MEKLNFPSFSFRVKNSENKSLIFDPFRKKFVVLTPEEWVRQHSLQYLVREINYPPSLLAIERQFELYDTVKRFDIAGFNPQGKISLIVECKAPQVSITQDSFDQIARYNLKLQADYLMVTNGLQHYFCQLVYEEERYQFLKQLPSYSQMHPVL
ncbi:type I restriction enzyme HsdR N-terminal domain-containing protein [Croceiramulus getboli]|nr:type I restriction enzyme HsdR N-terminal domain-containing protein [Flavobacteriaceae bacterium YJPT1-3]